MTKSRPLNKSDVEMIVKRALAARFNELEERLTKQEKELADRVHKALLDKNELAMAEKLGVGWVGTVQYSLSFVMPNGQYRQLTLDGDKTYFWPNRYHARDSVLQDTDAVAAIEKHEEEYESYRDARNQARLALIGLLSSVSTTKQLVDVWPQGRDFYLDVVHREPAIRAQLPAVRVAEVNELLGLNTLQPQEAQP